MPTRADSDLRRWKGLREREREGEGERAGKIARENEQPGPPRRWQSYRGASLIIKCLSGRPGVPTRTESDLHR